jgi:hypothetical protein
LKLSIALLLGVGIAVLIGQIEDHNRKGQEDAPPAAVLQVQ